MRDSREISQSIRGQLAALGLWGEGSLVMLAVDGSRTVLDAEGAEADGALFAGVAAPLAALTRGPYTGACEKDIGPLRACTDDMAQMFGPQVCRAEKPGADPAYIIPGRGFLVTGRFESELIAACILMEKLCQAHALAPKLGGLRPLPAPLCALEHRDYLDKYSQAARRAAAGEAPAPAVPAEDVPDLALRRAVTDCGRRLAAGRLIQATWGNVSLRLDAGRFLITPSGVDYGRIRPEDVVEVRLEDGSYPPGQHPSSERRMHRRIYQARPDVGAVVHTHSAACQIFAACRKGLAAGGVDCPCADYAVSGSDALAENAAAVLAGHDGCVMANHGLVTVGESLEQALARAAKAEELAAALLGI